MKSEKPFNRREEGKRGERQAREFLVERGYRILEQNYQAGHIEIDLIAMHGDELVFIEVKMVNTDAFGVPEAKVDRRKQQRIARGALAYMTWNHIEDRDCRFDVIAVCRGKDGYRIEHFEDAFFLDRPAAGRSW